MKVNRRHTTLLTASLGLLLLAGTTGCMNSSADQSEASDPGADKSIFERVADVFNPAKTATVPADSTLKVRLLDSIHSGKTSPGATFRAKLTESIEVDGVIVLAEGAEVDGVVKSVERSKRVKGRAQLVLALDSMTAPDGTSVKLDTAPLLLKAKSEVKKDAVTIGATSAVGAAIGAVTGGGDGAAKGAAIGAAGGTGYVLLTRGDEVEAPVGAVLQFRLADDVEVPLAQ